MKKRFVILDGSSLIYRAFYALPLLTTGSGEYTNAIYGFSNMLMKLLQDLKPDLLVIAFDKGKKTFRNELFADYKGTRQATPTELSAQIPLLHELADAWGIAFIELAGYEADDIIGTLATKAVEQGYESLVVTGDRDAFQLIRPNLKVMFTKKGISELEAYDEAAFEAAYGLVPAQLVDLKGLMGDTSDNIPGVPGVGPKTATKLLAAYGTLEEVLLHIEEVAGKKLKERLRDNQEMAVLSKRLARINCEVPVEFTAEQYEITPDYDRLAEFCRRYEMRSVLKNIVQQPALPLDGLGFGTVEEALLPEYEVLDTLAGAEAFCRIVRQAGQVSLAPVYEGEVPELRFKGAALAADGHIGYAAADMPGWHSLLQLFSLPELFKCVHDLKGFYHAGLQPAGRVLDVQLAAYLLDPSKGHYEMESLLAAYAPEEAAPAQIAPGAETAVWQAFSLERLGSLLAEKLQAGGLQKLYDEMELPLVEVLAAMEQNGVYVNRQHLEQKSQQVGVQIHSLEREIYALAGAEFNINSPKQLGEILFERLELPVIKKTKTGYSTNAEVLEELRYQHPIVEKILSYRLWSKLKSTYLDSIGVLIAGKSQRVHTHFNQTVTATGRLSSSDPNLQNIPVRTLEGKEIRTLFEPGEGYDYLLSADYSQIELRLLAAMSGDKNFVEAFRHGQDIHARTASEVFNVPMEEMTPELRGRAKAVNFGIVYGISDYGLSRDLHISRKEAAGYIESYFAKCQGIKAFIDKTVAEARENGYVTTMFGRRRDLPAIRSSNYNQRTLAERMAMNTPIQGSAADIIKLAMIAAYRKLQAAGVKSRILLQVHDELVLEVTEDEVEQVSAILRESMEHIVELSVPLSIDINLGRNWAEAK